MSRKKNQPGCPCCKPPTCPPFILSGHLYDACTGIGVWGATITASCPGQTDVTTTTLGSGTIYNANPHSPILGSYTLSLPTAGPWTITAGSGGSSGQSYTLGGATGSASFHSPYSGPNCSATLDLCAVPATWPHCQITFYGCTIRPDAGAGYGTWGKLSGIGVCYPAATLTLSGPSYVPVPACLPAGYGYTSGYGTGPTTFSPSSPGGNAFDLGPLTPGHYSFEIDAPRYVAITGSFDVTCPTGGISNLSYTGAGPTYVGPAGSAAPSPSSLTYSTTSNPIYLQADSGYICINQVPLNPTVYLSIKGELHGLDWTPSLSAYFGSWLEPQDPAFTANLQPAGTPGTQCLGNPPGPGLARINATWDGATLTFHARMCDGLSHGYLWGEYPPETDAAQPPFVVGTSNQGAVSDQPCPLPLYVEGSMTFPGATSGYGPPFYTSEPYGISE